MKPDLFSGCVKEVGKLSLCLTAPRYKHIYGNLGTSIRILNLSKTKRRLLYLKTQFVPRSKHFSSRL